MSHTEKEYLAICKKLIEEKLRLENGTGSLKQRDLEYLADVIEEKSGIKLSLSTLKRLWRDDYEQTPHPSTLQALVSVLEMKDWQEFKFKWKQQPVTTTTSASPTAPVITTTPKKRLSRWLVVPLAAAVLVIIWLAITFNTHPPSSKKPIVTGPVTFTANKTVMQGVPNTVIFNYDLHNVKADSFFIQQSWNDREKYAIDPNGNYASSMYYFPGFHRAKLIANDSIIMRKFIHITTDGWFPLIRYNYYDKIPVYLQRKNIVANGMLHTDQANLLTSKVNMTTQFMQTWFNVREFNNLGSNNFVLDTRIKSDSIANFPCLTFQLMIMCEEHIFQVSLKPTGCAQDINVKMGEVYRDGRNMDLSALGCDLYQWQHVQIKVENKQATVFLNDKPVYTTAFKKEFGKLVGLAYTFDGTGSIDYVRLGEKEQQWVYVDEFN